MRKQPKVVIIEDNPMHQKIMLHILNKYFTKDVIVKANPKEAFPVLRAEKPDLVILDIEMPYMDGVEMLELIRNMEDLEDLKIVVFSSRVEKEVVLKVIKYNVLDFLHKGADQKFLVAKLAKHFKKFQTDNEKPTE